MNSLAEIPLIVITRDAAFLAFYLDKCKITNPKP